MKLIERLLQDMVRSKGSDLHLLSGEPPRSRRFGDLEPMGNQRITQEELRQYLNEIMSDFSREQFEKNDEVDFAYTVPGLSRFRVNVFRHLNGLGAVLRAIPAQAISLDELGLSKTLRSICRLRQGLVLVTGKTGSGKTTTLAAMVDEINRTRRGHIICIEDPIEFVHSRDKCLISQREIGQHTPSFASALRSALREDPDVILVGEMRDLETISLAVTAAETGILVLGTLHTNKAINTVDRIINVFPSKKQSQIRAMLSTSLRAVITQQLVRSNQEEGQLAALEILVNTPAVANLIREGKTDQLETVMQSDAVAGMQTMDTVLHKLVDSTLISLEEAYEKAWDKDAFQAE